MSWANDGSMIVGETNRGWGSAGTTNSGLQYMVWTGNHPMEMKTVKAMPDGFEIEFTYPVNKTKAQDLASYGGKSYIYKYHSVYGSPTVNEENLIIKGVKVSDDGLKARIVVENLRPYHVHELTVKGIESTTGLPVLHPTAYYTLNNIPAGDKLPLNQLSTKRTAVVEPKAAPKATTAKSAVPTYAEIEPLLVKNTCTACHSVNKRQVGPSYQDIAKRNYTNERIVQLIYTPEPKNWPEHETPMPALPQVPKAEALKIAQWINSLKK
jgi:cytochrome c551/c552